MSALSAGPQPTVWQTLQHCQHGGGIGLDYVYSVGRPPSNSAEQPVMLNARPKPVYLGGGTPEEQLNYITTKTLDSLGGRLTNKSRSAACVGAWGAFVVGGGAQFCWGRQGSSLTVQFGAGLGAGVGGGPSLSNETMEHSNGWGLFGQVAVPAGELSGALGVGCDRRPVASAGGSVGPGVGGLAGFQHTWAPSC